jgi:D-alanine-D-alanine ligase
MKRLRVLVLVREGLVPPESMDGYSDEEIDRWKVEFDVVATLHNMGHEVHPLGVQHDLSPIRRAILDWSPDITFMLLEEFHGLAVYDSAIVSYLELMRQPYTGCNPRGMLLSRDKALSKKILRFHRVATPRFAVFPRGKALKRMPSLRFPLIVKSVAEDASLGIAQASVVRDREALAARITFVQQRLGADALVEEYIEGREFYVGVIGNQRLETFPIWELVFSGLPDDVARIATAKVKWDRKYQKKYGITTTAAEGLPPALAAKISRLCKRVYRELHLSGYARIDLRMNEAGQVFVLEANANPNLAYGEDFAESAETGGISYEALLQRILKLGLKYQSPWKTVAVE